MATFTQFHAGSDHRGSKLVTVLFPAESVLTFKDFTHRQLESLTKSQFDLAGSALCFAMAVTLVHQNVLGWVIYLKKDLSTTGVDFFLTEHVE